MINHLKNIHKIDLEPNKAALQKRLSSVFETSGSPDKGTWSRRLVLWLCEDLLPFTLVNGSGFQKWMVRNQYITDLKQIPTNVSVSQAALDDCYFTIKKAYTMKIQEAPSVIVVSADMWTSQAKQPYITMNIRFMESQMKLFTAVAATEYLKRPHTGETIAKAISDNLTSSGLNDRIVIMVGDNGANLKRLGPHTNARGIQDPCLSQCSVYISCLGHTVHLVLQTDLQKCNSYKKVEAAITRIKKIHGKLSYKADELKATYQQQKLVDLVNCMNEVEESVNALLLDEMNEEFFDEEADEIAHEAAREAAREVARETYNDISAGQFTRFEQFNTTRWLSSEKVVNSFIKNYSKFIVHQLLGS